MLQSHSKLAEWFVKYDRFIFPIGAALLARIFIALIGIFTVTTTVMQHPVEFYHGALIPLEPTGLNILAAPFQRWDAVWYDIIATRGYAATDSSVAFFPLFPSLMRLLSFGTGYTLLVGVVLATAATAGAFILFYQIAARLFDVKAARLGIVIWAAFPTAFYLFIPYAEALLVLLAIAALEAARRNHWVAAGILGGLAALTRPPGVWVAGPLGFMWLEQARTQTNLMRLRTLLPLALVPLGLLLHMLYLQLNFGDALLWAHALSAWDYRFSFPWDTIAAQVNEILFGDGSLRLNNLLDFGTTVFALGLVLLGLLSQDLHTLSRRGWKPRLPWAYGLYGLAFIFVPLTAVAHGFQLDHLPMGSAGRRAIVIFPAFLLSGVLLQGRFRAPLWIALSLGVQVFCAYLFSHWLWID